MAEFKYEAITLDGKKVTGQYETEHESQVLAMLKEKGYMATSIKEKSSSKEITLRAFSKVKTKDLAVFCRQFQVMLDAGVSIVKCIDILREQTENRKFKEVLGKVYDGIQRGITLSKAMHGYSDVFPKLFVHMVEAGEASGSLDVIMDRLAVHYEKEFKIQNKIKSAMIYPIVLACVSVLCVAFLLMFVMPTFVGLFDSSGAELPGPTKFVMNLSDGLKHHWMLIMLIILAFLYLMKIARKTDKGRMILDTIKIKIPKIKWSVNKVITSRFTRTLSTLLKSGIPLIDAMEIVAKVVQNKVVEDGLLKARDELKKGIDLATPINNMGFFPPMVVSMIRIGEESGALDDILDKTANFYDEEVEVAMQKMVSILEPLMIIIMGLLIGGMVIAMVLPMFDMFNTVKF